MCCPVEARPIMKPKQPTETKPLHAVCEYCGKAFILGVDGTIYGCDECSGCVRRTDGTAILPEELHVPKRQRRAAGAGVGR